MLTSQLQQLQEQMNSMNNSGERQEVESNYTGRLSDVSSQFAVIPSSRSMRSRDKRLPLDIWNTLGLQENILAINLLYLIHPDNILKELTLAQHTENEDISSTSCRDREPGRSGSQGMLVTGGGGPAARVPNLRVGWQTQGRKGELTSRRGTV